MVPLHKMGLIYGMLASVLLVRDDAGLSQQPAQTTATEPKPELHETRQMRRARERREAKERRALL
jgi:hypothetical protein